MFLKVNSQSSGLTMVFILTIFLHMNYAEEIYSGISTYFVSCDSLLAATAGELSDISKLDATDKLLLEKMPVYPEFEYLMCVNSKGKIISKVTGDKVLPRTYRYVGKQMWYKTVDLNTRPYYGGIVNKKGYYLFWVKPLLVWTKYGSRFGGALVAKINIKKSFIGIAEKSDTKFQVAYRGKSIFSNLEKESPPSLTEKKLAVYGMQDLTLKYGKPVARQKPVAAVAAQQQAPEAKVSEAVPVEEKDKKPQKAVASEKAKADVAQTSAKDEEKKVVPGKVSAGKKEKEKKSRYISVTTAIAFIIVCIVLVVVCFIIMKRAADKNRKIIESIDKGDL